MARAIAQGQSGPPRATVRRASLRRAGERGAAGARPPPLPPRRQPARRAATAAGVALIGKRHPGSRVPVQRLLVLGGGGDSRSTGSRGSPGCRRPPPAEPFPDATIIAAKPARLIRPLPPGEGTKPRREGHGDQHVAVAPSCWERGLVQAPARPRRPPAETRTPRPPTARSD